MPDIEERVTTLEREMSALKARVGANEADMQSIPDLIRAEFRLTNSQIARLSRDVAELRELPAKIDALPRVVAEIMLEKLAERERTSESATSQCRMSLKNRQSWSNCARVRSELHGPRANCRPSARACARVGSPVRIRRARVCR